MQKGLGPPVSPASQRVTIEGVLNHEEGISRGKVSAAVPFGVPRGTELGPVPKVRVGLLIILHLFVATDCMASAGEARQPLSAGFVRRPKLKCHKGLPLY